jgi:hypothetical protein
MDGGVGVEWCAPKAGALPGCATPREPGREGLFNLIKSNPPTLKYEAGVIVAGGDFVIVHGRFSSFGAPVNWIAADIVRLQDGMLEGCRFKPEPWLPSMLAVHLCVRATSSLCALNACLAKAQNAASI